MPTKPLLIVEGAPGSGKSTFCQLLQLALMGHRKPVVLSRNREDDFPVILLRSPICVFDNLDSYVDWIPDKVCAYTTTGSFPKRKLYTDGEEYELRPHSFIAVASKNPASFRREDTADRVLIMRLDRRDSSGLAFTPLNILVEETLTRRAQLFGEYLYYVNRIVAEIRNGALEAPEGESFRMADFASIARAVAKVLEWPPEAVPELLYAIQSEQTAFFNEADPLVELLGRWLDQKQSGRSSVGRLIDAFQLHKELESIAQASGIQFYKQATMMQKLRSPHVERDFIVQTFPIDGGSKAYRFWRKAAGAQLSLVPMPAEAPQAQSEDENEDGEGEGGVAEG